MRRDLLEAILAATFRIECKLDQIGKEGQVADQDITALAAEVSNNTSVFNSALAVIQGIAAQIASAVANASSLSTSDRASLEASIATLQANDTTLANAIVANTPAAPAAPAAAAAAS
jgi:hypothetical protein